MARTNVPQTRATTKARRRRRWSRVLGIGSVIALAVGVASCTSRDVYNPDYPATRQEIVDDLERMEADPVELDRPVVLLSGYRSMHTFVGRLHSRLAPVTTGDKDDFLAISYPMGDDIERIASTVVKKVDERWPSEDPLETVEVDVVAISMGGLVARTASAPHGFIANEREKRLKIRNLYTLASPHRGAKLAELIRPDKAARDMKPGSGYLARLDELLPEIDYTITPYAVLNDSWVGATNASPTGQQPIWTPGTHMFSHFSLAADKRILADLARRLRKEEPLGRPSEPPTD